jgi:hypothetical protein
MFINYPLQSPCEQKLAMCTHPKSLAMLLVIYEVLEVTRNFCLHVTNCTWKVRIYTVVILYKNNLFRIVFTDQTFSTENQSYVRLEEKSM